MNLKELKGMIAEEYSRYLKEQEDVAVDVQPDDVDAMGPEMGGEEGEDPEATLRTIYDMLSDYFEGGEEEMGDVEGGEEPMDDVEGEEAPEADLEEWNGKNDKKATTTKSGQFGAGGYKKFSKSSGHTGFGDKGGSLNEVKRMQKLANIIKG